MTFMAIWEMELVTMKDIYSRDRSKIPVCSIRPIRSTKGCWANLKKGAEEVQRGAERQQEGREQQEGSREVRLA